MKSLFYIRRFIVTISLFASSAVMSQISNFSGTSIVLSANHSALYFKGGDSDYAGIPFWSGSVQMAQGYVLGPRNSASFGFSFSTNKANENDPFVLKNRLSVYYEPGYLLHAGTLVYGKFSYELASLGFVSHHSGSSSTNGVVTSSWDYINIDYAKVKGYGLGVGMRTMLTRKYFTQLEIKQVNYSWSTLASTNFKSMGQEASLGIGLRF